ncbi:MAG: DUF3365 domain-containing protein [Proteobacteria bacterium]|nr:DUF3365 domain-containing protein [Pseudomonadota bacterium]
MNKKIALFALLTLTTSAVYAEDIGKYQEEARAVAMPFLKQLGAANKKAVSEGGPESAVKICKDIAPQMAGDISRQTGWKLTRVSLKVRNPLLGTPDAWEQKALLEFEARAAKGEKADTMEVAEIVQEPAGKSFRFIKAIALQPGCVACHGSAEQISDNVKARLSEEYPHDMATGYRVDQIRGAVSIKRPM